MGAEIFAVYGAPWILVIGAALLAWRNHLAMREARKRDSSSAASVSEGRSPQRQKNADL